MSAMKGRAASGRAPFFLPGGLSRPVDGASLSAFRIMLGLLMAAYCVHMLRGQYLHALYVQPKMLFTFLGFDWVQRASLPLLQGLTVTMLVAALCFAAGIATRLAAALFGSIWTYFFLLEKAYYINHFYLVSLLMFLFVTTPTNGASGIRPIQAVPAWVLWAFRAQFGIVYAFAGLAKLQPDWLAGEPMRAFLRPYFDSATPLDVAALAFSWGGLAFDLLIVPALLWRKTRAAAALLAAVFHLSNHQLFNIDFFPWLAMAGTLLFFDPDWPRHAMARIGLRRQAPKIGDRPIAASRFVAGILCIYFAIQVIVPFQRVLYPGNAHWTEEGQRYSWLLMMKNKVGRIEFSVVDHDAGKTTPVHLKRYLNDRQILMVTGDPDMQVQFAHFLADEARKNGAGEVSVHADTEVSLNGRAGQPIVPRDFDLAAAKRKWGHYEWIVPLRDD